MKRETSNSPRRRDFTRSEFLGASFAAGAGAMYAPTVGTDAPDAAANTEPRQPVDCESDELRWGIGLRHLSALWSNLLPRIVAAQWGGDALGGSLSFKSSVPDLPAPDPAAPINDRIGDWIDWALDEDFGSGEYRARIMLLRDYWDAMSEVPDGDGPPVDRRPPVRFRGTGAFDFYLSNEGIDLYVPDLTDAPYNSRLEHLLYYFTIRETGRPALGTPGVDAEYTMPAKTGASQLTAIDPDTVEMMVAEVTSLMGIDPANICGYRNGLRLSLDAAFRPVRIDPQEFPPDQAEGPRIDHESVADAEERDEAIGRRRAKVDMVLRSAGSRFRQDLERIIEEAWTEWEAAARRGRGNLPGQRNAWWGPPGRRVGLGGQQPPPRAVVARIIGADPDDCTSITDEDVMCEEVRTRCWQLEGSVFRGIAEQHPRVVAQTWFRAVHDTGEFPDPYETTIDYRRAMMDTLETALPSKMRCEVDDGTGRPDWYDTVSDLPDPPAELTVTNLGLHFPPVQPPGVADDATTAFLAEVVVGRAGNPVFTDSRLSL